MMISPEAYYEEFLNGKTIDQIQTVIRRLKREIGHLKNTMENPEYPFELHICPDESTQLWSTRLYLERAKQALADFGGEYRPSKAELIAAEFDENIPSIHTFKFSIGGFFGGYETHTITVDGEALHRDSEHSLIPKPSNFCIPPDDPMTKDEFLSAVREMHMGEWRHSYNTRRFGYVVCDGTQWEIEITYSNGHKPVRFYGDNAYPYNFDSLKELFGISEDLLEDEDNE